MLLSFIIPTKNEESNIERILKSIFINKYFQKDQSEVIVVDNIGTTDKTREIVGNYPVKLFIIGPERSSQRNYGASQASGDYLVFLDADMEVTEDLFQEIIKLTESAKANSKKLSFIIPERIPGDKIYTRARDIEKQVYIGNRKISASRIFPRDWFEQSGGFDIGMISGEDWELDRRFLREGGQNEFTQNHLLHHEEGLDLIKSVSKKIYYAKNIKNYKIGIQTEVNPLYRILILFSKPALIFKQPLAFCYLIVLKLSEFGAGFAAYVLNRLTAK